MKLWMLQPVDGSPQWNPWYDRAFGFVVRAETEQQARAIANENAGDENGYGKTPWLDENCSTCEPLTYDGDAGLVMRDFASA